jgi:magnesium chelatase family protein
MGYGFRMHVLSALPRGAGASIVRISAVSRAATQRATFQEQEVSPALVTAGVTERYSFTCDPPMPSIKTRSVTDLACFVAGLLAAGRIPEGAVIDRLFVGALRNGEVHGTRAVLTAVLAAQHAGMRAAFVPWLQAGSIASMVAIPVIGVHDTASLVQVLRAEAEDVPFAQRAPEPYIYPMPDLPPMPQPWIRAAEAMAVAHGEVHGLFVGAHASSVAHLVRALLPAPTDAEHVEHSSAMSNAGHTTWKRERPLRTPHETISIEALVGSRYKGAGDLGLAHTGVVLLDNAGDFSARVLVDAMAAAMRGSYALGTDDGPVLVPSRFTLVAAAARCLCRRSSCECPPDRRQLHMDRLKSHVDKAGGVFAVRMGEVDGPRVALSPEMLEALQARVARARGLWAGGGLPGALACLDGRRDVSDAVDMVHFW